MKKFKNVKVAGKDKVAGEMIKSENESLIDWVQKL